MKTLKAVVLLISFWIVLGCGSETPKNSSNPPTNPPPTPNPPTPTSVMITSLSPASVAMGSADVQLIITGTGFPAQPTLKGQHPGVAWDAGASNENLSVADSDATHVTAVIPAALLTNPGTHSIQVSIWHFADDMPLASSNVVQFRVTD
jgi:hypothetical protein